MHAVNRRAFLEVSIALGAQAAWAMPFAAASQFQPFEGYHLNAMELGSGAPDSVVPFRIAIPQSISYGYNLVRYTRMPRGGHFAALEQPELFCEEVADFFHSLPEARY